MKDQLIQKQRELIKLLDYFALLPRSENIDKNKLEAEIAELEEQLPIIDISTNSNFADCPLCEAKAKYNSASDIWVGER